MYGWCEYPSLNNRKIFIVFKNNKSCFTYQKETYHIRNMLITKHLKLTHMKVKRNFSASLGKCKNAGAKKRFYFPLSETCYLIHFSTAVF